MPRNPSHRSEEPHRTGSRSLYCFQLLQVRRAQPRLLRGGSHTASSGSGRDFGPTGFGPCPTAGGHLPAGTREETQRRQLPAPSEGLCERGYCYKTRKVRDGFSRALKKKKNNNTNKGQQLLVWQGNLTRSQHRLQWGHKPNPSSTSLWFLQGRSGQLGTAIKSSKGKVASVLA